MQPLMPGQTAYKDFGHLNIRIDMHHDGVSILVTHHATLNRAFTSVDQGRDYLKLLRDMGRAGSQIWEIEAEAAKLIDLGPLADDEQAIAAGITATLDQRDKERQAKQDADRDTVQAAVGDGRGWHRFSTQQRAATTSEPMDRVLASADQRGYITRSKTATSTQLIALASRNLVVLDKQWQGRTQRLAGAWLYGRKPEVAA